MLTAFGNFMCHQHWCCFHGPRTTTWMFLCDTDRTSLGTCLKGCFLCLQQQILHHQTQCVLSSVAMQQKSQSQVNSFVRRLDVGSHRFRPRLPWSASFPSPLTFRIWHFFTQLFSSACIIWPYQCSCLSCTLDPMCLILFSQGAHILPFIYMDITHSPKDAAFIPL